MGWLSRPQTGNQTILLLPRLDRSRLIVSDFHSFIPPKGFWGKIQ